MTEPIITAIIVSLSTVLGAFLSIAGGFIQETISDKKLHFRDLNGKREKLYMELATLIQAVSMDKTGEKNISDYIAKLLKMNISAEYRIYCSKKVSQYFSTYIESAEKYHLNDQSFPKQNLLVEMLRAGQEVICQIQEEFGVDY